MDNESAKLDKLVIKSKRKLLEVTSVFPFDFFPDTIRVDENKVDFVYRQFFSIKHVVSIMISDISTVLLTSGVFFASVHIQLNKPKPNDPDIFLGEPVNYLWKKDAIKVKRIILGLVVARQEDIDLSGIPMNELIVKIEEIGKSREFPRL